MKKSRKVILTIVAIVAVFIISNILVSRKKEQAFEPLLEPQKQADPPYSEPLPGQDKG